MFESDDDEFSSIAPTDEVDVPPVLMLSCVVLLLAVPPATAPPDDSEKADMALVASNVGLVTVAANGRFKSSRPSGTGNFASSSRSCR